MEPIVKTQATLGPEQLFDFLVEYLPTDIPIVVHGSPAIGKSQIIDQAARRVFGPDCVIADVRAGQLDSCVVRGFPYTAADAGGQLLSRFAPLALWPTRGPGIVKLDELDKAEPETLNALLEFLLEGRIGEYQKPADIYRVGAANLVTDRAYGNRLGNAVNTRVMHVELVPSVEGWLAHATRMSFHALVVRYVELKGISALYSFDPTDTTARSFPAPRTWENLSKGLQHSRNDNLLYHLTASCIGANSVAADFVAFARWYFHLPPREEVIANASTFALPTEGANRWALAVGLVEWSRGASKSDLDALVTATLRLTPELVTFALVHIIARNPACFKLPKVMQWALANNKLLNSRGIDTKKGVAS